MDNNNNTASDRQFRLLVCEMCKVVAGEVIIFLCCHKKVVVELQSSINASS